LSNARAARRRSQKNKKTAHRTDIHIFFNGGWFDGIKDAEYHIQQIARQAAIKYPVFALQRLRFQAHHVQSGTSDQAELFPKGELIHFAFSEKVNQQSRDIIKGAANGYFCELLSAAREDLRDKGLEDKDISEPSIQKPDVVLWFNTSHPELSIDNNNTLFREICLMASSFGFGVDGLIFQPNYITEGEDLEGRPAISFSFSPSVNDHQRHIISNVVASYAKEKIGEHLKVQEIPAQESPGLPLSSDSDQSSDK